MDPSIIIWIAIIFAVLFVADRIAQVFINHKREEELTGRAKEQTAQFKDMTDKAVKLLQTLHGGIEADAVRSFGRPTVEGEPQPDWRGQSNGTGAYQQRVPTSPTTHRPAETAGR